MTLRLETRGKNYTLSIDGDSYTAIAEDDGGQVASGSAQVLQIAPGLYSILFEDGTSVMADVRSGAELDIHAAEHRFSIAVGDRRDRRSSARDSGADGPREVRSQMPGKVIKIFVSDGQTVEAGDGLMVIEAMKMQNETQSPKSGVVRRVAVKEGTAVSAGELLAVVD